MSRRPPIPGLTNSTPPVFGPDAPWLAPLAGYSDLPFRLLCREFGAKVCETEMISAKGLLHANQATGRLLHNTGADAPLVVQLFGSDTQSMAYAVRQLADAGYAYFDCNMGCSVRKVMRQGAGAALLGDVAAAAAIADAMISTLRERHPRGMVGFKLRLGLTRELRVIPDLALRLEDLGASWLTLHPRYACQGFGGTADWDELQGLAERLSIPLLASGDLFTAQDGVRCINETGVSGVMYARGALKEPAIFQAHAALLAGDAPPMLSRTLLRHIIERHLQLVEEHGDRTAALLRMRSLAPRYAHTLPGASRLRRALCACSSWEDLEAVLDDFMAS